MQGKQASVKNADLRRLQCVKIYERGRHSRDVVKLPNDNVLNDNLAGITE